jgi:predicted nucleotidyltransferase
LDERVWAYIEAVVAVCEEELGAHLISVWIVGSLATGDFDPRRSDIDVLISCAAPLDERIKRALGHRLSHRELPCPAHGVDILVYPATELLPLSRSPRYEFSISSGVDWVDDIGLGDHYPGGLIDLAAARRVGIAILGPSPEESLGPCPPEWIMEELTKGVRWHTTRVHDPFHDPTGSNAVLNACRALHFFTSGILVSKTAGARWLLERTAVPVVAAALAERAAGGGSKPLDRTDVLAFLDSVLDDLRTGAL